MVCGAISLGKMLLLPHPGWDPCLEKWLSAERLLSELREALGLFN